MELIWFLFFEHYFSFFTNHLPASTSFARSVVEGVGRGD